MYIVHVHYKDTHIANFFLPNKLLFLKCLLYTLKSTITYILLYNAIKILFFDRSNRVLSCITLNVVYYRVFYEKHFVHVFLCMKIHDTRNPRVSCIKITSRHNNFMLYTVFVCAFRSIASIYKALTLNQCTVYTITNNLYCVFEIRKLRTVDSCVLLSVLRRPAYWIPCRVQ